MKFEREINSDPKKLGYESKSPAFESLCLKLFEYTKKQVGLEEPKTFIKELIENSIKPFLHIYHPPLKERGLKPSDAPVSVDEMMEELNKRGIREFWKGELDYYDLYILGVEKIPITCRNYSIWAGNILKFLRIHSDRYPGFEKLGVRYRWGVARCLDVEGKNERFGNHIWIEMTLDGKDWLTFDPIYPFSERHPPENYLTMNELYDKFGLELEKNKVCVNEEGKLNYVDPVQVYNKGVIGDLLLLLNKHVLHSSQADVIYELENGEKVLIERRKIKRMGDDLEKYLAGGLRKGYSYGLEKDRRVFEEVKAIIPHLSKPNYEKLKEYSEKIEVKLYKL